jgi:ankyrin repeat protein
MNYLAYPWKGAFEPYSCGTGSLRGATPLWLAASAANGGGDRMARRGGSGTSTVAPAERRSDPSVEIMGRLLAAGADPRIPTDDGTTPLMVAAGLGRCTNDYTLQRGARSQGGEEAVTVLLDAGVDVNAVNEADFSALHGAAFRGLNEIIQILAARGATINARDYRGRTPHRLAEGSKQSFYFQGYPETTEFIKKLGANVDLGLPGNIQERLRSVVAGSPQQP